MAADTTGLDFDWEQEQRGKYFLFGSVGIVPFHKSERHEERGKPHFLLCQASVTGNFFHDAFEFVWKLQRLQSVVGEALVVCGLAFFDVRLQFGVWIYAVPARVFGPIDFHFLWPRWQSKFGANFVAQF